MSDAQLGTIIAFIATFAAGLFTFIKWAVGQWREERKADRDERKEVRAEVRADGAEERKADRDERKEVRTEVRADGAEDRTVLREVARSVIDLSSKFTSLEARLVEAAEPKSRRADTRPGLVR